MLIFYYLLSPILSQLIKKNAKTVLIGCAVLQFLAVILFYLRVYSSAFPSEFNSWVDIGPIQYLRFIFYLPFGITCSIFFKNIKESLGGVMVVILPTITLIFFISSVLETLVPYHIGGSAWPQGGDIAKFSTALFSAGFLLCFVLFDKIKIPFQQKVIKLGTNSYGLYLAHYPILAIVFYFIRPLIVSWPLGDLIFIPLLIFLTIMLYFCITTFFSLLPIKNLHRYVFG